MAANSNSVTQTIAEEKLSGQEYLNCCVLRGSFFFTVALRPNAGHGLLILEVSRSPKTTHHSR